VNEKKKNWKNKHQKKNAHQIPHGHVSYPKSAALERLAHAAKATMRSQMT